jgi:uncharacterized protein (TIGR02271 family)
LKGLCRNLTPFKPLHCCIRKGDVMQDPHRTIPLVEEELVVGRKSVTTGRVRVSTRTDLVEESASLDLQRDSVEVTRVTIDREIDEVPSVRTEGDVTIVPVVEEVLVVEKRLVLKEELHIRRQVINEQVDVPVTLRKQRAIVERIDSDGNTETEEEDLK